DGLVCLIIFEENQDDYPLVSLKLCEYKNFRNIPTSSIVSCLITDFLGGVSYKSVYYIVDV
ncbi:MAG: hypothetical protein K2G90_03670, partial [Muribaculaceae bacterium]|nr:hypothetical protein [Muribaculaceae bacterium]